MKKYYLHDVTNNVTMDYYEVSKETYENYGKTLFNNYSFDLMTMEDDSEDVIKVYKRILVHSNDIIYKFVAVDVEEEIKPKLFLIDIENDTVICEVSQELVKYEDSVFNKLILEMIYDDSLDEIKEILEHQYKALGLSEKEFNKRIYTIRVDK